MNNDFSSPQRQSLTGIFIMFADTLQSSLRALLPILVITVLKGNYNKPCFIAVAVAAVMLTLIIGYLKYLNFTFFIDEENEEFVVRKGILSKTRIAIPLNKIQHVNINQSLLQKIVGVHALEVDTAGSSKKEVTIRAITQAHAVSLKDRLLEDTVSVAHTDTDGNEVYPTATLTKQRPFIQISLLSLLKTGITSNYVRSFGILLAFFISTFQHLDDFFKYTGYKNNALDKYFSTEVLLRFVASITFTILILTLLVNVGRTIIRYFDFKITRQPNGLLLSHGLITTRNTILRPDKVQIVTVGRNYFQKKFNINDIRVSQASDLEANNKEQRKSALEIPGCSNAEKKVLLEFLLEKTPERGFKVKPNFRKMIFESFKFLVVPIGIFFIFACNLTPGLMDYILFVPVYSVLVAVLIYFAFRHSRLFVSPDFIIKQSGAWDIDNAFVAPHKIQAVKMTQLFWQRSSNVGTIKLYTAGGNISFGLANFTQLKRLANYWLYQVETASRNWM
jgi:putative membrane protein